MSRRVIYGDAYPEHTHKNCLHQMCFHQMNLYIKNISTYLGSHFAVGRETELWLLPIQWPVFPVMQRLSCDASPSFPSPPPYVFSFCSAALFSSCPLLNPGDIIMAFPRSLVFTPEAERAMSTARGGAAAPAQPSKFPLNLVSTPDVERAMSSSRNYGAGSVADEANPEAESQDTAKTMAVTRNDQIPKMPLPGLNLLSTPESGLITGATAEYPTIGDRYELLGPAELGQTPTNVKARKHEFRHARTATRQIATREVEFGPLGVSLVYRADTMGKGVGVRGDIREGVTPGRNGETTTHWSRKDWYLDGAGQEEEEEQDVVMMDKLPEV
ncbi:hypothetical protein FN846DRAFT_889360 [Sphaerosporella brunnea]|uniref:Uncharacterized protein n=1 Tax=Sphaerosporella brunnea TaxID=1250544 RepID=A0A5J5F082_9PEZI|nr:hypothetical protein FN846DRAFT_889360 [Sphaerosporella brunnea]